MFWSLFSPLNLVIIQAFLILKVMDSWYLVAHSANSFMQNILKLYMYFDHGLKICVWFGYKTKIIFVTFFHKLNLPLFFRRNLYKSEWIVGILCAQVSNSFIPKTLKLQGVFVMV